jgi:hypothetical protein
LLMSLPLVPVPAALTMMPFAWLPNDTLFRSLTFEPPTKRIPLPLVLPNDTRPVIALAGGVPGVCSIQTPAA